MKRIAIIEDDPAIGDMLQEVLQRDRYQVERAYSGTEALYLLKERKPDLILLDLMLPGLSGEEILSQMQGVPVIVVSAKADVDDKVKLLLKGAADYVTKPFSIKELIARVNKILLRSKKQCIIKVRDITFDMDKLVLYKNGKKIDLTALELKLVNLLFTNINKVVSRNTLLDKIWEWTGNDIDDHTITVYFKRIREKIETDIIITVKGVGYRIDEE